MIGNQGTTADEQRTQFSLWCITKAPLMMSTDLRAASNATISILRNKAAIAVNQDALGVPGRLVRRTAAGGQVWTGPLSGGRYAAVLVNLNSSTELPVQLTWGQLPGTVPAARSLRVRDLWNVTDGGDLGEHTALIELRVKPHGSRMIVLEPAPPVGEARGPKPVVLKAVDTAARAVRLDCVTDLDCNLNGVCSAANSTCRCDSPWVGPHCGVLGYAVTPVSAKDITPSGPGNTWGGPVIGPEPDGKYHAFVPRYPAGELFGAKHVLHGTADVATGPYAWTTMADVAGGTNPALLVRPFSGSDFHWGNWCGLMWAAVGAIHRRRVLSSPGPPRLTVAGSVLFLFFGGGFIPRTKRL